MSKSLSASNKIMKNYLSELLTDVAEEKNSIDELEKQAKDKQLESLLDKVNLAKQDNAAMPLSRHPHDDRAPESVDELQIAPVKTRKSRAAGTSPTKSVNRDSFQAMFFEVAGLTVAVPLIELGGIHHIEKTNTLMGKPNWYKGVMVHREQNINVVDTAMWVMPEKCNQELLDSIKYQYVIMLNDSDWGLAAEHLVDTVTLQHDDVKWLDNPSKRKWLAGLVKDKMCALLDVDSLIDLLEDGVNINHD